VSPEVNKLGRCDVVCNKLHKIAEKQAKIIFLSFSEGQRKVTDNKCRYYFNDLSFKLLKYAQGVVTILTL